MTSATDDVVLSIVGSAMNANRESDGSSYASTSQDGFEIKSSNKMVNDSGIRLPEKNNIAVIRTENLTHEITRLSPMSTPQRPPKTPTEAVRRRASMARSAFSRSKSRLAEPPYPNDASLIEESSTHVVAPKSPFMNSPYRVSPRMSVTTPRTPRIPLTPVNGEDEEEDEEVYKSINLLVNQRNGKKLKVSALLEWVILISLLGLLVASLIIHRLQQTFMWSLPLWKWCVLGIVIFCGRLVTEWSIDLLVFFVELNFLLKRKVLYFVYGLKRSVQVFLWLGFILVAWILLFSHGIQRSRRVTKILHYITMALAGCLVGAGMWLLKTLFIKTLALKFHVKRFFDRIQETLFHQYVLQILSGPPLMEMAETVAHSKSGGLLSFERLSKSKGVKEDVIDIEKLHKINQKKVSAWTMKGLINVIRRSKLSTISNSLDFHKNDELGEQNKEITSEWEAKAAALKIFKNVAKHGCKYIEEEDLLRFMKMDEVEQVFPLFQGAIETGKIKKSVLRKWVVDAYLERKSLAHSLNDTKTAVEELNKIASTVILVAIVIVWNLMMGFLTTKILVFITSQLLLVAFMFSNTVKTVFEAIIFVFIMHPFDVGDRCVIDGVQMVVEEMNILTTIFLRYDNEKIIYPNSVLSTKPISNYYRSPEMGDSVEFAIDFSTTAETIAALKVRIKGYLESKPQHWRPSHSVQVKEILEVDKIKMALYVTHTINFQNSGEKNSRRSDLVLELKKIFEQLRIRYRLLPQDVHVTYVGSPASTSVAHC